MNLDTRIRLIANRTLTVLTVLSAIVLASLLVTKIVTGNASVFGFRLMHVVSESMEPTIMTGDYVVGKAVGADEVGVGDIATYRLYDAEGKLTGYTIIHRVYEILPDGRYVFWGDNNPAPDPEPVDPEQIGFLILGFEKEETS